MICGSKSHPSILLFLINQIDRNLVLAELSKNEMGEPLF